MTSSCNLRCPMCYASSGPGGAHLSYDECVRSIDRLVAVEGRAEVLQLSGGEPTIHPEFLRVLEYAAAQPIDIVMINTNGIRLAHDRELLDGIERLKHRVEVYFQFDGFDDRGSKVLRGEPLVETKLKAIEALGVAGSRRRWSARFSRASTSTRSARSCGSGWNGRGSRASASSRRPTRAATSCPRTWSGGSPSPT